MSKAISADLMDEIRQTKSELSRTGGTNFWKPPTNDGKNYRIRILPGTYGNSGKRWYVTSRQHWANQKAYECPQGADPDAHCAFCEQLSVLRKQENALKAKLKSNNDNTARKKLERQSKKLTEMIKQLLPRQQYLLNILVWKGKGEEGNEWPYEPAPKAYRAPKSVFEEMLDAWAAEGDEGNDLFDPTEGNDFRLAKKKEGNRTTYTVQTVPKKSPIAEKRGRYRRTAEEALRP
jgi:hypothetical protein